MHELSIACRIIEAAEAEAQTRGARRVVSVSCRIGATRQVEVDSLKEGFAIARTGTLAEEATLQVSIVGMSLACTDCGHTELFPTWTFECPSCGSGKIRLSGGDDLELTSIELEVSDECSGCAQERAVNQ